jgi:phosphate starvation-inducible PhoH-like protein
MQKIINLGPPEIAAAVFGAGDRYADAIGKAFGVHIRNARASGEDGVLIEGANEEALENAAQVLSYLVQRASRGEVIGEQTVSYAIGLAEDGEFSSLEQFDKDVVCVTMRGKPIKPKTVGQKKYVSAIKSNTIVFGVGPAGTGKTFLAVAMAVEALRNHKVNRIVLTRPAVEAGERLGFLPGDLQSKIDPYLRPLYDALFEMLGAENYAHYVEKNVIEIAPLAYMRGRTLDDSFIILDEAQNTSAEQMKMFLTRLGTNSKAVVTDNPSQTDLPGGVKSGLGVAVRILDGIEDIAIHRFTERDVVRHRLVQRIIKAYEKYDKEKNGKNTDGKKKVLRYTVKRKERS